MQHAAVEQLTAPPVPSITAEYLSYNKGPLYLVIVATLGSIALSTFLLRVHTRIKLLHFFGIDDCLCLVAVVSHPKIKMIKRSESNPHALQFCSIGALVVFIALERLGIGKHIYAIPAENLTQLVRWQWYFTLFIVIGISFVKLSVAFFLLRIIHRPYYRRFLYNMIGLLVPLTLVWFGTFASQCVPVSKVWEPFVRSPRCISRTTYWDLVIFNNGKCTKAICLKNLNQNSSRQRCHRSYFCNTTDTHSMDASNQPPSTNRPSCRPQSRLPVSTFAPTLPFQRSLRPALALPQSYEYP